jgi:hypothetical protein
MTRRGLAIVAGLVLAGLVQPPAALAQTRAAAATGSGASATTSSHSGGSAPGLATATIIEPLRVRVLADMDFGPIAAGSGNGGTVTIGSGSARYAGGASAGCSGADCPNPHAARFVISGEPGRSYTITLPDSVTARAVDSPEGATAPPLTVSGLSLHSGSGGSPRLDAGGSDTVEVGGTIALPADSPATHYRASLSVIVTFI